MAKTDNRPKEKMDLDIELADNGIILRDPNDEDIVTLALYGDQPDSKEYRSEVYRAIGQRVYDWLLEVAMAEHCDHWVSTGAHIDITATLTGRPMR